MINVIEVGAYLGVATSIITELIQLFPYFDTKRKKQYLAIGVAVIFTLIAGYAQSSLVVYSPVEYIGLFGTILTVSYGFYKQLIKAIL